MEVALGSVVVGVEDEPIRLLLHCGAFYPQGGDIRTEVFHGVVFVASLKGEKFAPVLESIQPPKRGTANP